MIWLLAVTAVVFTTSDAALLEMETEPAEADPQTAGDALDEQFPPVPWRTSVPNT